ncbi:MAG: TlpA family protein disulfide reductase, partial [Alphaproteobacteria bacterium]|nr:TlpA family protein disulfide reductase [Alphaproteobacteria bacterium]
RPFPDMPLVTLDGDKVRASDYRGKTVIITFFQSWDVWSTDEMKAFRAARKRYGDHLAILAVNYRAFSSDVSPLSNTVAAVPRDVDLSDIRRTIDVKRIPEIWIVDRSGAVVDRESYLPEHRLLALLDKMVK